MPWALLVKDMPQEKHQDLDFIVEQLDWEANVDPTSRRPTCSARARPSASEGYVDGGSSTAASTAPSCSPRRS